MPITLLRPSLTQVHVPLRVGRDAHFVDAPPRLSGAWQLKETQDEIEMDAWRTVRSRYRHPEFSADFGVHWDTAASGRL